MKFTKCLLLIFLFLFPLSVLSKEYCFDTPMCIAELTLEKSIMFNYDELQDYTCTKQLSNLYKYQKRSEEKIKEYKKKGLDIRGQAIYDFSNIKYEIFKTVKNEVEIYARGKYAVSIKKHAFNYEKNIEVIIFLSNEDGKWKACGIKN